VLKDIELYTHFVQHLANYCFRPLTSPRPNIARLDGRLTTIDTLPGGPVKLLERILIEFYTNGEIKQAVYFLIPQDEAYENLVAEKVIPRSELVGINWGSRGDYEKLRDTWKRQFSFQIAPTTPKITAVTADFLTFGKLVRALTLAGFAPTTGLFGNIRLERKVDEALLGNERIPMTEVVEVEVSDQGRITGGTLQLIPDAEDKRGLGVHKKLSRSDLENGDVTRWMNVTRWTLFIRDARKGERDPNEKP